MELIAFPEQSLCIVNCLVEYIDCISSSRCQQQLIIYYKTYKVIEKATIARHIFTLSNNRESISQSSPVIQLELPQH